MSLYLGSTPIANTGYDKANTGLSNLTSTGKNIANWSNNVTNCITEIPQDIKLELDNGTLTLKAGSKVCVPNGFESDGTTPKFDEVVTSVDKTFTSSATFSFLAYYDSSNSALTRDLNGNIASVSGTTAPSNPSNFQVWYDTANNLAKRWNGSSWVSGFSLPLAIITATGSITSIDQVFNGFGYIGSTVFALPGVKGLIPNGRNADGTLKSIEVTKTNVEVWTSTSEFDFDLSLFPDGDMNTTDYKNSYYDEDNNIYYVTSSHTQGMSCGRGRFTSSGVLFLEPKSVYRALDYSDSPTISGWAMPSSRYINLTLGASGTSYTAPANGYIAIAKKATSTGQYIYMGTNSGGTPAVSITSVSFDSSGYVQAFLPVRKGDKVKVSYTVAGTTAFFNFVYAEGEQ